MITFDCLLQLIDTTLQRTATLGASILNSLVGGNVVLQHEETARQFVAVLSRLSRQQQQQQQQHNRQKMPQQQQQQQQRKHTVSSSAPLSVVLQHSPSRGESVIGGAGGDSSPYPSQQQQQQQQHQHQQERRRSSLGAATATATAAAAAAAADTDSSSISFFTALLEYSRRRLIEHERLIQRVGPHTPLLLALPTMKGK
ncbi:hypothetical protein, conserved [Eimeria praecox]|uniref:Uncharacterized protein n=1 Tax=Eimeria praecox TaxID=51316 RepID=U6H142_9EIME|nr:hypothetical protein, conserved [Eimeria praecox]